MDWDTLLLFLFTIPFFFFLSYFVLDVFQAVRSDTKIPSGVVTQPLYAFLELSPLLQFFFLLE
jgi:hypothetical protein